MRFSLRLLTLLTTGSALALFPNMLTARSQGSTDQGSATVVASYSVLCDLTRQIAQDTVGVTCLIEAGEDPHVYNATPSDRRAIEEADLLLYSGYNFEPNIIQMIEASDTAVPTVAVAEVAVTEPLIGGHHHHDHGGHSDEMHAEGEHNGHDEEGEHDQEEHEEHDEEDRAADPHVWHDAENGVAMVSVIQAQLSEAFPDNASLYQVNAETLSTQLTQLDAWIQQQIDTVPESQRVLVSTHDALGYYADAYGLRLEPALASFSTEVRPSAADLRELVDFVEDNNVPTIFVESTSNPRLIEAVSRETDIGISESPIYADSLGETGTPAGTYQGMLMTNTCTIVEGLGGQCDAATAQAIME